MLRPNCPVRHTKANPLKANCPFSMRYVNPSRTVGTHTSYRNKLELADNGVASAPMAVGGLADTATSVAREPLFTRRN